MEGWQKRIAGEERGCRAAYDPIGGVGGNRVGEGCTRGRMAKIKRVAGVIARDIDRNGGITWQPCPSWLAGVFAASVRTSFLETAFCLPACRSCSDSSTLEAV